MNRDGNLICVPARHSLAVWFLDGASLSSLSCSTRRIRSVRGESSRRSDAAQEPADSVQRFPQSSSRFTPLPRFCRFCDWFGNCFQS